MLAARSSLEIASEAVRDLLPLAVPIPADALAPAAEVRQQLRSRRRDCSYVDALGYGVARSLRIPLLIADASFEGVNGVERIEIRPRSKQRAP